MMAKLEALIRSRRFWVAIAGVLFAVTDGLGLPFSEIQMIEVVIMAGAWIVGDSLRPTV